MRKTGLHPRRGSGMVGLGLLPDEYLESHAADVSADGSRIVGVGMDSTAYYGQQPFLWDEVHGMRELDEVLVNVYGLDLTGWELGRATAISDDGLTIVGEGRNPEGVPEAWIAVIPEPSSALLLTGGLAGLAAAGRRRRAQGLH